MIYMDPSKSWEVDKDRILAEIQIENCHYFWKSKDIIMITNFPYEYRGFKATVIEDTSWLPTEYVTIFNNVWRFFGFFLLPYLIKRGYLNDDLIYGHDLDAYQVHDLDLPPLDRDLGLVDYGFASKINLGNVFFKPHKVLDIFRMIGEYMLKWKINEEEVLVKLQKDNVNNINSRFRKLNITYNIGSRHVPRNVNYAEKPIKVAHFQAWYPEKMKEFKPYLPERLYKLLYEKFAHLY